MVQSSSSLNSCGTCFNLAVQSSTLIFNGISVNKQTLIRSRLQQRMFAPSWIHSVLFLACGDEGQRDEAALTWQHPWRYSGSVPGDRCSGTYISCTTIAPATFLFLLMTEWGELQSLDMQRSVCAVTAAVIHLSLLTYAIAFLFEDIHLLGCVCMYEMQPGSVCKHSACLHMHVCVWFK